MCGISGLITKKSIPEGRFQDFIKSADLMSHRGPDYKGIFWENNILLIHHRLSILDLDSRSHQPFKSGCGQFITVFNGEIYNFRELASKYCITQRTSSDTEIMLESFAKSGIQAVKEWNGIFASVIYDQPRQQIHFVRDRFGVKPLYYFEDDEVLVFASEAKVIMNWMNSFKMNKEALSQFIWFGNTTGEKTFVDGLHKFQPGLLYSYDLTKNKFKNSSVFWSLTNVKEIEITEDEAIVQSKLLLEKAVHRQLVSDVPVGVLLSGGIDSSSIVAFASKHYSRKLDTYSVEYDYNMGGESELAKAAMVAKKFGTNHHELKVETKDVASIFSDLVFQYDEPFADPASVPLYQLAKACSKDKRVILQGDGGDELFGGYRRYNVMRDYYFWRFATAFYPFILNHRWRERMKRINFVLKQSHRSMLLAYYLTEEVPYKSPYRILKEDFRQEVEYVKWFSDYSVSVQRFKNYERVQQLLYVDTEILLPNRYLEKVDKATMLNSIEARVPFLDNELAEYALSLPARLKVQKGQKKYILKKAMEGLVPNKILYGPKRGFDAPFREWLRRDLYEFARTTFEDHGLGILDSSNLLDLLNQHRTRKVDYSTLLWKSLVLCHWLKIYRNKIEA